MRALCLISLAFCAASSAMAQNIEPRPDDITVVESHAVTSTGLTIYPDDLGFIRETRTVDLPAGLVDIQFFGVSDQIIPETALLESFEGLRLERNFDSDLISPGKLLARSVGQFVTIRRLNPVTGTADLVRAKLISAAPTVNNEVNATFSTPEGVEAFQCSGLSEALILNNLPDDLNAIPVLSTRVRVTDPGPKEITLVYLSRGLSWSADYRMDIYDRNDEVGLLGWLTMKNETSRKFKDTELSVVAGRVNRADTPDPSSGGRNWDRIASCIFQGHSVAERVVSGEYFGAYDGDTVIVTGSRRASPVNVAVQQDLGDYKLYRAPQAVTVAPHQTKQIAFLSKDNVELKANGTYRWDFAKIEDEYDDYFDDDEANLFPPIFGTTLYALDNEKDGNLAVPLPAGTVRTMSQSPDGLNIFLGEDNIRNSPIGQPIELEIGKSFLVTAQFIPFNDKKRDVGVKVEVRNASDERITAEFDMDMFEDIEIIQNGKTKSLPDGDRLYRLSVPAEGQTSFTFTADWR